MSTNTLTSLAILKVNVDQGRDYLDYLRPFIFQVLADYDPDPITSNLISQYIQEKFGLDIPEASIDIVLKRISKRYSLKKQGHVYRRTGDLPDPQIGSKQAETERHIGSILHGLQQFSTGTVNPIRGNDEAINAICAFLNEFNITCLRAYLRGTAIPQLQPTQATDIVLVSDYVQHIQRTSPERFNSFVVLLQGHMLANALMCPDLHQAPQTYKNVTFYIDTPILVHLIGSEGRDKQTAARDLFTLVNDLGGKLATFSHSRDELQGVLRGTAYNLDSSDARGGIVLESRKQGITKSDLLLIAEVVDDKLAEAGIAVEETPPYIEDFQIDEGVFEQALKDGLWYFNPRARLRDVNSVRSIYVIRGNKRSSYLEKAQAVLVTSNSAFARTAWEYGQEYEASKDVSSVITDFTLANMAWLKAPMGAPSVPMTQLLAFSYAALEPSSSLLEKYLSEIDKLETQGSITERDHQLLRSSPFAYDEIVHFTQGNESSLTDEVITQTLQRVSDDIRREESEKLVSERASHDETRTELLSQRASNQQIIRNIYWRCRRRASVGACMISGTVVILLLLGLTSGFGFLSGVGLRLSAPVSWVVAGGSAVLFLLSGLNLVFGSTVRDIHMRLEKKLTTWFLNRDSKALGVELSEIDGS